MISGAGGSLVEYIVSDGYKTVTRRHHLSFGCASMFIDSIDIEMDGKCIESANRCYCDLTP